MVAQVAIHLKYWFKEGDKIIKSIKIDPNEQW